MALITLTPLQYQAGSMLITLATNALARYEMVKDMTDEQCQVLIDNALEFTEDLDDRLAGH